MKKYEGLVLRCIVQKNPIYVSADRGKLFGETIQPGDCVLFDRTHGTYMIIPEGTNISNNEFTVLAKVYDKLICEWITAKCICIADEPTEFDGGVISIVPL